MSKKELITVELDKEKRELLTKILKNSFYLTVDIEEKEKIVDLALSLKEYVLYKRLVDSLNEFNGWKRFM